MTDAALSGYQRLARGKICGQARGVITPDLFVAIPAYRDRDLPATLLDLYARATRPERLRVVVAWQHGPRERLPKRVGELPHLTILASPAAASRGPNWARRLLQQRYRGEAYILLIDSHHRFVPGWDQLAIGMLDDLKRVSPKPLLTAYLPPFNPATDPRGRGRSVRKIYPLRRSDGLLTHLTGHRVTLARWLTAPIPAHFASLHFLLAEGRFFDDVPFEPAVYFFGDEVLTGLRAFTHGYDMFHPHRILGWHAYSRATRVPHWDDHDGAVEAEEMSFALIRETVSGRTRRQRLLGAVRSVRDYEKYIGHKLLDREAGEIT